jgi:flagellar motility protein MotE (MotC chaperone)
VQAQAATGGKAGTAAADAPARVDATEAALGRKGPLDALPPNASAAQQYCFNTTDSAADARFAWQAKKIKDMEAELEKRAQQLEAKTAEYKTWLERRDEFARKAHEKLVGFYSGMRPDAAAGQLAELDEEMAAAVVIKLQTKVASQIMGEMDPERAAKIATIISGAAKVPPNRRRQEAPANAPAAGASTPEGPRS